MKCFKVLHVKANILYLLKIYLGGLSILSCLGYLFLWLF